MRSRVAFDPERLYEGSLDVGMEKDTSVKMQRTPLSE